jgi:C1A family cysteine protease
VEQELSLGWLPDHPDWRDYSATDQQLDPPAGEKKVPEILEALGVAKPSFGEELQSAVDLSGEFSPVEDQRDLGSCTANAAAGLIEYFERRAMGQHVEASRISSTRPPET